VYLKHGKELDSISLLSVYAKSANLIYKVEVRRWNVFCSLIPIIWQDLIYKILSRLLLPRTC